MTTRRSGSWSAIRWVLFKKFQKSACSWRQHHRQQQFQKWSDKIVNDDEDEADSVNLISAQKCNQPSSDQSHQLIFIKITHLFCFLKKVVWCHRFHSENLKSNQKTGWQSTELLTVTVGHQQGFSKHPDPESRSPAAPRCGPSSWHLPPQNYWDLFFQNIK